jgi:hypothetical protein
MRDHDDLHRRLDAVATRSRVHMRELEELLTEGYARALAGEAQSRRLERRLEELLPVIDDPAAAKEARRLTLQRRTVDQAVRELREKLAKLRGTIGAPPNGRPSTST